MVKLSKIRKAVFPVAGLGTRFLPATKAMPKELLPIVDKPLIQYAVEEAISTGIETLIFITGRNKRAIEDHFDKHYELEAALRKANKPEIANMIGDIIPSHVTRVFIRQNEQLGLGHAILCAESALNDEPFAVLLADDFITDSDNKRGVTADLVAAFEKSGQSQLSVMKVEDQDISKYGILKFSQTNMAVTGLVEKPKINEAPSNFASIGRYVLTSEIFSILKGLNAGSNDEIQLADALNSLALEGKVSSVMVRGRRFDCGTVRGFIEANNYEYMKRIDRHE